MLDRTRLAKVLAMTTSDNDAEALSAIRRANEIIKGENMQWADIIAVDATALINIVLQRKPPAAGPVDGDDKDWQPTYLREASIINPMFQAIYAQPRAGNEDFWRWLDDVHEKWRTKATLTPNQYSALRRCYNRTLIRPRA